MSELGFYSFMMEDTEQCRLVSSLYICLKLLYYFWTMEYICFLFADLIK